MKRVSYSRKLIIVGAGWSIRKIMFKRDSKLTHMHIGRAGVRACRCNNTIGQRYGTAELSNHLYKSTYVHYNCAHLSIGGNDLILPFIVHSSPKSFNLTILAHAFPLAAAVH